LALSVLRAIDIDDRLARGTDNANAPRGKRDAVRGEIDAGGGKVGAEEVLETSAGLHEVEEVTEGLRLPEMQLRLIRKDVVVHLECDEQIQYDRLAAPVQRRAHVAGPRLQREGIGGVGRSDEGGV